ncbi:MAG: oligosaccharide flippase family protein [Bacilli bacterium]|nr:oligosaccharide flippase family protein [Bacilli bacterium]
MKKSLFFKSAFILLIGSLVTRTLGFLIRIIFTRIIGSAGINLYSLVMPTYSLVISLTQLGLPMAISTIVARGTKSGKKIVISVVPIILLLNISMMIGIIFSAKFIACTLLDEPLAVYPIMAMAFILPFISVSSILRGYFFGKQKMMPHTISNIIEQIARFIIIILFLPKIVEISPVYGVSAFILLSIISEFISIVVFLFYLPKNFTIEKKDLKPDLKTTREVMSLSLPTVGGRIIGNVAYFFEPIILTYVMKAVGYSNSFIVSEYGIYNAYVIPLLVIPSFIVQAISTALIPEISRSFEKRDSKNIHKRLKQSLVLCLILGLITNVFVFLFPEFLLRVVYDTSSGIDYIRILAIFFILYNFEGPLSSTLQALGKTKEAFRATTIGVLIKTVSIAVFSLFKIGLYGLVIGEILDILFVVGINYKNIKKVLKKERL